MEKIKLLKLNILIISFLSIFLFNGCGEPTPQELRQIAYEKKQNENYAKWIKAGYTKQDADRWKIEGKMNFKPAIDFLNIGITNPKKAHRYAREYFLMPKEIKEWIAIGVSIDKITSYRTKYLTPIEVKKWFDLNITSSNDIKSWSRYLRADEASKWIAMGLTDLDIIKKYKRVVNSPSELSEWQSVGIDDIDTIQKWKSINKSSNEAKKWIDSKLSFDIAKQYNYEQFTSMLKDYNMSADEFVAWNNFGEKDIKIINFWKSKGYKYPKIKNTTAGDILDSMSNPKFFKFVGIKDVRLMNGYLYHWKYTDNYSRFYKIMGMKDIYNINQM